MYRQLILLLCLSSVLNVAMAQEKPKVTQNDLMYPSADVAKPFIDMDGKGFMIKGKHTFLKSGTIHYPRVPSALWEDRLMRIKRAGFDAVESYAFWNYHEPQENAWDFTGEKDFEGFLGTAQKLGLYAIVRVGPYVCAEWDFGGYPVWLKFKPPFLTRTSDEGYLKLNDHWYDKILPIVAKHQINRGGNVLMVQLENEHPNGWGVVNDDPYFSHLKQQAIKYHIEVPYFFSGLHHGGPPAVGDINTTTRTNPWFTTEFWAGWFDAYRTLSDKRIRNIDQTTWSIQAHAAGGYNFYMIHGGTNFETWNDASTAASYDYGTAIGQTGDLRLMYYRMKRANQLAQSFPNIIGNAVDAGSSLKNMVSGEGIEVLGAPQSADGTILYIRNKTQNEAVAKFTGGETLRIPCYTTYPIPVDAKVSDHIKIKTSSLPILAVAHHTNIATAIIYGEPGQTGKVSLSLKPDAKLINASKAFKSVIKKGSVELLVTIPKNGVEELNIGQAGESLRLLAINHDLSLYTWLIGEPNEQNVVFGPAYVKELNKSEDGKISVIVERPYGTSSPQRIAVYGAKNKSWNLAVKENLKLDDAPAPVLGKWQMAPAAEAMTSFDDSKWMSSVKPLEMGADGDISAFAWYRTVFNAPAAGTGELKFKFSDDADVYVNGHLAKNINGVFSAAFVAGKNTIAVFVSHSGRDKQYDYLGTLNDRSSKGILGDVNLAINGGSTLLNNWKMHGGASSVKPENASWQNVDNGLGLPGFFQAKFNTARPGTLGAYPILRATFAGLSRGTMWINGHNLGRYPEKIRVNSLYIPECWLKSGENTLVIFDETGAQPSQVKLMVEKEASRELIKAEGAISEHVPIVVPQENPVREISGQNRDNLAFRKSVTAVASSPGSDPRAITDGNSDTQWAALNDERNSSFIIDFEKPEVIKVAEIYWGQEAKKYKYTLEGSNDHQSWIKMGDQSTAVPSSPDSPSELSRLNLPGNKYRYIKVTINSGRSMKVVEFKAYAK
ncbi:beta-galactosidase [Pedobacter nutrimenti]|uniref:beta-galactosidase n=1 Tax=Pedobacter nutrimenti TaxID=1241337 RepID=UPI00292E2F95|nr:beta-galactosidase [Pedobacter nutrimenti]